MQVQLLLSAPKRVKMAQKTLFWARFYYNFCDKVVFWGVNWGVKCLDLRPFFYVIKLFKNLTTSCHAALLSFSRGNMYIKSCHIPP